MRKNILAAVLIALLILSQAASALGIGLLAGYRSSGAAAGLTLEQPVTDRIGIRIGAVTSSGTPQTIYLLGAKTYLGDAAGVYPTYLVLGFTPETSLYNNGAGISLVFNNAFGVRQLFFEAGVDVTYAGGQTTAQAAIRPQAMLGYGIVL